MTMNKQSFQVCVCAHRSHSRSSVFGRFDVVSGCVVLTVIAAVLLFIAKEVLLLVFLPLLLTVWLACFGVWALKGHAPRCPIRRATILVLGAAGGFWMVA